MSRRDVTHFTTRRNPDDHIAAEEVLHIHMPPRPPFDVWLADRNAKAQVLGNSAELLQWIDDKLDDDTLIPLTEALDKISIKDSHAIAALKHPTSTTEIVVGDTTDVGGGTICTAVWFHTSKQALED